MDLKINFSGLCLFVTPSSNDAIHVLMPHTPLRAPGGAHIHKHLPKLSIDGKSWFDMKGYCIDLSEIGGAGNVVEPPVEVLRVGGRLVMSPRQWGMSPSKEVAFRVTLPGAVEIEPGETAEYEVLVDTVGSVGIKPLTNAVTCRFRGIDAGYFTGWTRSKLRSNDAPSALPVPAATGSEIELHIRHEPRMKMHHLKKGKEAVHFQAYYTLFGGGVKERAHPRLYKDEVHRGASPYNCMLGGSPGGP
jgi:hypothetical protein